MDGAGDTIESVASKYLLLQSDLLSEAQRALVADEAAEDQRRTALEAERHRQAERVRE